MDNEAGHQLSHGHTTLQGAGNTWRQNELSLSSEVVASFGTRAHCRGKLEN